MNSPASLRFTNLNSQASLRPWFPILMVLPGLAVETRETLIKPDESRDTPEYSTIMQRRLV